MDATTIAILAAALILTLDRFGLLERFGLVVKPKSTGDFESELKLADRKLVRLEAEHAALQVKADTLEKERSITPVLTTVAVVLDLVEQSAHTQNKVLDKLVDFNGTLARLAEGLREATEAQHTSTEALKLVTGLVIGVNDLPVKEP